MTSSQSPDMSTTSTELAHVLVDEMVRCGVQEAVLAPGSRNAPLSFALQKADAAGRLRLHVRIDERSAGFLALGLAKASGRSVPVVCTSGTAAANLYPAMLEASHSGVPLIALTADRPAELHGSGANQTTDQTRLFGVAPRWAVTLATGVAASSARSAIDRALGWATGALSNDGGPVHINVAFSEPLVGELAPNTIASRGDGPWTTIAPTSMARAGLSPASARIRLTPRTIMIAGDGSTELGSRAVTFAQRYGIPLIAEPSSFAWGRALAHGSLLLQPSAWLDANLPDQVVVVGKPTVSRSVSKLLADPRIMTVVVADSPRWADATLTADIVLGISALVPEPTGVLPDQSWGQAWAAASERAAGVVAKATESGWPSGLAVAREAYAALPADARLTVGASNPIRDLELAATPRRDVPVIASRGLAGIDGTMSTAIGISLANPNVKDYALMGDLTFLHDSNGLIIGPDEPKPDLTVVVLNDNGGGIFSTLEQGDPRYGDRFERVFGTPHGMDLQSLCAASGTSYRQIRSLEKLRNQLQRPPSGIRVLEVATQRTGLRAAHQKLAADVAEALSN
jgi:2-succinyl-5-enolpyruvyl-6-hydroxy-3-cyclohexene-1-carboxylate synthase